MNILVIQLARLGDILLSWPQVRALRKKYPEANIDMLVRPKFKIATEGLVELNRVIEFPVENIFEPLLKVPLNLEGSLLAVQTIIEQLRESNYDWIINSTLSPSSSYLTYELQTEKTKVTGYSRTTDGYLSIYGDVSTYFYAQVGVDRNNRIHLADLFTMMLDLQPDPDDWKTTVNKPSSLPINEYLVLHVGASRKDKRFSPFKWRTFITHFQKLSKLPIILIGNEEEINDSSFIALGFESNQVLDYTGKLNFSDLFPLISNAKLYVGCDSAPLHIASLVNTPALNISFATVNFWETGPRSKGSRVLYAATEADLPSERVAQEALQILESREAASNETPNPRITDSNDFIYTIEDTPSFRAPPNSHNQDWGWMLLKALYMNEEWPAIKSKTLQQGLKNLLDVNRVMLDQLNTIKISRNVNLVSGIIERCEEVIESIGSLVPELCSLIRWYQTQKTLIKPGAPQAIFDATEKVHLDFDSIIQYWLSKDQKSMEDRHESSQP